MMLVTLEQAMRHLRILVDDTDPETLPDADEVTFKATHASTIVLDFCTDEDKGDWTDGTVPGEVQAATLVILSDLWEYRAGSGEEDVFLSVAAKSLLQRHRDPSFA